MYDIITIGSATRDVFLLSKDFRSRKSQNFLSGQAFCFDVGAKVEMDDIFFATGGGGTNSAATFARFGLKCACVSKIGDDPGGRASLEDLTKLKIDTRFIKKSSQDNTAYSVIISTPTVGRTILVYRGASKRFQPTDIPWTKLSQARWLYITSLGGNVGLLKRIVNSAQQSGVKIALNPGSGELKNGLTRLKPILSKVDALLLNEEEARGLLKVDKRESKKNIARKLSEVVAGGIVVITRGNAGVVVAAAGPSAGEPACPVGRAGKYYQAGTLGGKIVERSGAGDAFGSGFITGLIKKDSVEYAIQLGSANANSVIKYLGAKNGLLKKNGLTKIRKIKIIISNL
ncbi:MAG: carbohydrate kinase family protein [Parcubacteria group bacterium]|nr:carbohydrate kinase family protein [Parcubacteria group bacterium]